MYRKIVGMKPIETRIDEDIVQFFVRNQRQWYKIAYNCE